MRPKWRMKERLGDEISKFVRIFKNKLVILKFSFCFNVLYGIISLFLFVFYLFLFISLFFIYVFNFIFGVLFSLFRTKILNCGHAFETPCTL